MTGKTKAPGPSANSAKGISTIKDSQVSVTPSVGTIRQHRTPYKRCHPPGRKCADIPAIGKKLRLYASTAKSEIVTIFSGGYRSAYSGGHGGVSRAVVVLADDPLRLLCISNSSYACAGVRVALLVHDFVHHCDGRFSEDAQRGIDDFIPVILTNSLRDNHRMYRNQ